MNHHPYPDAEKREVVLTPTQVRAWAEVNGRRVIETLTAEQAALDIPEPAHVEPAPNPLDGLTAGQKLRRRQEAAWKSGAHPLGVALRTFIPLHAEATRNPETAGDGPTCGTCANRQQMGGSSRNYPKCFADQGRRITHGPGTDVLTTWPACTKWTPKDAA